MRGFAPLLLLFIGATQAPATEPASANTVAARNEAGGQQNLSHGTTRVNGVRLHYVAAGPKEGQAVVLLHGWPQTWYEWPAAFRSPADGQYRSTFWHEFENAVPRKIPQFPAIDFQIEAIKSELRLL